MSDKIFVGNDVSDLDFADRKQPITKVILTRDSDTWFESGTDEGRTLEASNPWATQDMADSILAAVVGYQHQPFSATDAVLDPAAEIGDAVTIGGLYGEIDQMSTELDSGCLSDISAPGVDEIEDEYPYKSNANREMDRNLKGVYSLITKNDEEIRLFVTDEIEGVESELTQTANSLTSQIKSVSGDVSTLEQTTTSLSSKITSAQGDISSLEQTANSLSSQISSAQGDISSLEQTTSSLSSRISNAENDVSSIEQKVDSITLSVNNDEDRSYISLYAGGIELSSDTIRFTGGVVFESDLANGRTSIDGGCIDTGEIDVDFVNLYGEMSVRKTRSGSIGGYIGYCEGNSDSGIGVMEDYDTGQCICTNGGAKLAYGSDEQYLGVARNNVYASQDISIDSDRRIKEDIRYDLDEYEDFFRALKPCSFLRKRRTSGRRHTGFVAQEIEEALKASNKTNMDFAALVYDPYARRYESNEQTPKTVETGTYQVRYTEIIALNTAMIQKLMKRVDSLEKELLALKGEK